MFDFLAGLYDKTLGRVIPTRFALFGTVGGLGVVVHFVVLLGAIVSCWAKASRWRRRALLLVAMTSTSGSTTG